MSYHAVWNVQTRAGFAKPGEPIAAEDLDEAGAKRLLEQGAIEADPDAKDRTRASASGKPAGGTSQAQAGGKARTPAGGKALKPTGEEAASDEVEVKKDEGGAAA